MTTINVAVPDWFLWVCVAYLILRTLAVSYGTYLKYSLRDLARRSAKCEKLIAEIEGKWDAGVIR